MANKITEEKVIKWAEEYATRMKDFILNDKNAKYNSKAVQDAEELISYLSLYKYGADKYKTYALKWITAVYKNS